MRVMVFVKATKESETGELPSGEVFEQMGKYNEELVKAGVMQMAEGLKPTKEGKRVRFSGAERTVIDGPFAETKELIAGFWLWKVESMDEAISWLKKAPFGGGMEIELRPVFEMGDFGDAMSDEAKAREAALRKKLEQ